MRKKVAKVRRAKARSAGKKGGEDMPHDPYHDPHDSTYLVSQSLNELEQAKRQGLFGIMRMRWEAFLEERLAAPLLRKMDTKQKLLEAERATQEKAGRLFREQGQIRRELEQQAIAQVEVRNQRLMVEGALIPKPLPGAEASNPTSDPPLRPYLTDDQITALASRFLRQLPHGADFDAGWNQFRSQVGVAIPEQILVEIRSRAQKLMGDGGNQGG